jgi:uncharacterized membrane protein
MDEAGKIANERIESLHGRGRQMSAMEKTAAVLIGVIAVVLAIAEINVHYSMKTTLVAELRLANQEMALTAVESDRAMLENGAVLLSAVAKAGDQPSIQSGHGRALLGARAARLNAQEANTRKAAAVTEAKVAHSSEEYDNLEIAVGFLQVAIVLVSLSIVVGTVWLLLGGALGGLAGLMFVIYALYLL